MVGKAWLATVGQPMVAGAHFRKTNREWQDCPEAEMDIIFQRQTPEIQFFQQDPTSESFSKPHPPNSAS